MPLRILAITLSSGILGLGMLYGHYASWILNAGLFAASSTADLFKFLNWYFFSAWFVAFVVFVLLLEQIRPANSSQALLSRGFLYDGTVAGITLLFYFCVVAAILRLMYQTYDSLLPSLGPHVSDIPNGARAVMALILADLVHWCDHFVKHKVPWLWRLHAMHHSQRELNIFSEFRLHPLDMVAGALLWSAPSYVLSVPYESSVLLSVGMKYYLMFIHSNIDLGYGVLEFLFVSPRYHRLHHGIRLAISQF